MSADLIRRPAQQRKGATSFDNFVLRSFAAIDEADDSMSVARAVESARDVLCARNLSFGKLADAAIRSGALTDELPPELQDDAGTTPTILRLVLNRHRRHIGLDGEVVLSTSINKMERGIRLNAIDLAGIRNARSRARLAFQMGGAA